MNALFLTNHNVDYLITAGGHYLAYVKTLKMVIYNRFTPGEPHLIAFLGKTPPRLAKIPSIGDSPSNLDILKAAAKSQFKLTDLHITKGEVSSQDPDQFEEMVSKLK